MICDFVVLLLWGVAKENLSRWLTGNTYPKQSCRLQHESSVRSGWWITMISGVPAVKCRCRFPLVPGALSASGKPRGKLQFAVELNWMRCLGRSATVVRHWWTAATGHHEGGWAKAVLKWMRLFCCFSSGWMLMNLSVRSRWLVVMAWMCEWSCWLWSEWLKLCLFFRLGWGCALLVIKMRWWLFFFSCLDAYVIGCFFCVILF